MKTGIKIVLLQGAFDLINAGHIMAFERAKAQGDYLIVAINSNRLLMKYKGYISTLPWKQKAKIVSSICFVDKVVRADDFSPLDLLRRFDVDVYVCTREWASTKKREIAFMKRKGGRVYWSPRFPGVVSNIEIKKRIVAEAKKRGWT